jgi:hypothetical protein
MKPNQFHNTQRIAAINISMVVLTTTPAIEGSSF